MADESSIADKERGGPSENHQPQRRRRFVLKVLVSLGSLTIALCIAELALYLFAPLTYHEWLIWEAEGHIRARPVPNQVVLTATGAEVCINQHGFRGPDYDFAKAPGTLRIVVLSGSAGFCFHAAGDEKTWPGALELKLKAKLDMPVEVVNLSLPDFDSFNSKINYLCFGRAFEPDAVIVYHTWNDLKSFRRVPTAPYRAVSTVRSRPLWQRVGRATQIGRWVRKVTWGITKRRLEGAAQELEHSGKGHDAPVDEKAYEWERKNFDDIVTLAKKDGVLPILVSQASLLSDESLKNQEARLALVDVGRLGRMSLGRCLEVWLRVSKIIEDVALQQGAIFVDGYSAVPHDLDHLRDHVHLHDVGSELLASEIATTILADDRFLELVSRVRAEVK